MPIAQLNIATSRYDVDDPRMAEFMTNLDRVNAIAERSKGFIWRLADESGNATDIKREGDPRKLLNISVWATPQDLANYVFGTIHKQFYKRGLEWFEAPKAPHFVIWHVADGHIPNIDEALEALSHLTEHGPTDEIYGWSGLPNAQEIMEKRCA